MILVVLLDLKTALHNYKEFEFKVDGKTYHAIEGQSDYPKTDNPVVEIEQIL